MISAHLLFGPCHGEIMYIQERPGDTIRAHPKGEAVPMFQKYEFGEPVGMPRPSMMAETHLYRLHDVLENGTEEVVLYLHDEQCCDKELDKSDHYRKNKPRTPDEMPRIRKLRGDIW